MVAVLEFIRTILQALLSLSVFVVILYAVMSWLVGFNVINLRNRGVYQVTQALERLARPLLAPIQRFLPNFGGLDISPVIYIIVVQAINSKLIPPLFDWLEHLFGGTYRV